MIVKKMIESGNVFFTMVRMRAQAVKAMEVMKAKEQMSKVIRFLVSHLLMRRLQPIALMTVHGKYS